MKVEFNLTGSTLVISPDGEIDHHETKTMREEIDEYISKNVPEKIVFDFSRTAFMDSSGLGLILGRYRKAKEVGVEFEIVNPGEKIMKILTMAGIEKFITIKGVSK